MKLRWMNIQCYHIVRNEYIWRSIIKTVKCVLHYVKLTNPPSYKTIFPNVDIHTGDTWFNLRHQTTPEQSVAKPEISRCQRVTRSIQYSKTMSRDTNIQEGAYLHNQNYLVAESQNFADHKYQDCDQNPSNRSNRHDERSLYQGINKLDIKWHSTPEEHTSQNQY